MKSLLHSLEGSETVLLMYLFNELPEEDRAEVESMLRTDAGLRAQFQQLHAAYEHVDRLITAADKDAAKRMRSVRVAERNAITLMKQWEVEQLVQRPAPQRTSPVRKWLLYPATGVAAVLIMGLILWGIFGPTPKPEIGSDVSWDPDQQAEQLVRDVTDSFGDDLADGSDAVIDPETEDLLVRSFDTSDDIIREVQISPHIRDAEWQLVAINQLTEDQDQLR
jgi:hypothetical protein